MIVTSNYTHLFGIYKPFYVWSSTFNVSQMDKLLSWILAEVKRLGLSQKHVALTAGTRPETISQYFTRQKRFTTRAARKIMLGTFGMGEKETELKIAECITRESVERMDNVSMRSAFRIDYRDTSPHVILMEDSKIKFCTKSYFYRMDKHYILAFQAGEIIDARYAVPIKDFKALFEAMKEEITDYERAHGDIDKI